MPLILKSPSLLTLVAVPLLINLGLYVLFFVYASGWLAGQVPLWVGALPASTPPWLAGAALWFLKISAWVLLILISAFSFTVVGGILAAPFNDHLSRRTTVVRVKRGLLPASAAAGRAELGFASAMVLEARRTVILVGGSVCALILGIIPFLQIPALILGSYVVAFEYLGYPMARRSSNLIDIWLFMAKNPVRSLGFGLSLLFLMALPLVGALYMPLAVVGGTMLFDDSQPGRRPS